MTDLDFDELDQAVNSAMGSSMGATERTKPAQPATVPAPATVSAPEKPIKIVSSRTSTPVAKRSTGRFMDVVHPSSDMRSAPKPEADKPPVETPTPPEVEKPAATSDWPDPLDFHGFKMDEPEKPAKTPDTDQAPSDDSSDAPLSSPFLSGAKVEKRPLGAFSVADEKPAAAADASSKPTFALPAFKLPGELKDESSSENDDISSQASSDQPVPPEFHSDLLSVESDASLIENTNEISPDTVKDASLIADEKPAKDAKKPSTPAPMPSIVQQYKEKAASNDQSSGAIYDTETYHKPIATVPKKKNGLLIVLWLLGLLVIGGAIGAAMYFYVLPLLV